MNIMNDVHEWFGSEQNWKCCLTRIWTAYAVRLYAPLYLISCTRSSVCGGLYVCVCVCVTLFLIYISYYFFVVFRLVSLRINSINTNMSQRTLFTVSIYYFYIFLFCTLLISMHSFIIEFYFRFLSFVVVVRNQKLNIRFYNFGLGWNLHWYFFFGFWLVFFRKLNSINTTATMLYQMVLIRFLLFFG